MSNVLPLTLLTHFPLMSIFCSETLGGACLGFAAGVGAVAVVMGEGSGE